MYWELYQKSQELCSQTRICEEMQCKHHRTESTFSHSMHVAAMSLFLCESFNLEQVDRDSLLRGALLHDYFLYNWRDEDPEKSLPYVWRGIRHLFRHPKIALGNAEQDLDINYVEKDIILHHMFPLTLLPPVTREGWIVSLADKICAIMEVTGMFSSYGKTAFVSERQRII